MPGVERSFPSFSAAAKEAPLSRIFASQHVSADEITARQLGRQVGDYVLHRLLLPTHPNHSS
jgi:hypothetical protein